MTIAQTTQETLGLMKNSLAKNVTIATGLSAYDLQAPAKNLYPTITPLRNSIPRVQRLNPGDAARWRTISSITGSGFDAMGWVPEGQRSASMSYAANSQVAPYVTLGEEDTVTFEAEAAAQGYEDINATATLRLLQKTMRKEETGLLGGNASLALGTPGTPILTASGTGATLPAATYSVIVVALSFEGYGNSSLAAGVATTKTITGNDGNTYTPQWRLFEQERQRHRRPSRLARPCSPPFQWSTAPSPTPGSSERRARRRCRRSPRSTAWRSPRRLRAGQQRDQRDFRRLLAQFDARLRRSADDRLQSRQQRLCAGAGPGTAGTGSFLTASGRGSVVEIDTMLMDMWNAYRLSPTVLYVNAQEQKNITNKCLTNASGPLIRYNIAADSDRGGPYGVSASGVVRWYYNPFSVDGGFDIPIQVHPDLPPGTILAYCERLPVWYQSNETPNVAEVLTRRDYYRVDWPVRTRRREFGVYAEEVLAVYAPFGVGILTNIGNG